MWRRQIENGDETSPTVTEEGVFVSMVCAHVYGFDTKKISRSISNIYILKIPGKRAA